jgi:hypothetical protein
MAMAMAMATAGTETGEALGGPATLMPTTWCIDCHLLGCGCMAPIYAAKHSRIVLIGFGERAEAR